jgi:hypothetical protein
MAIEAVGAVAFAVVMLALAGRLGELSSQPNLTVKLVGLGILSAASWAALRRAPRPESP